MAKYSFIVLFVASVFCVRAQNVLPVITKQVLAGSVKYQGNTNTCWSFSTTSLIESGEIARDKKDIDLSETFTAREMFMEKARRYILSGGTTFFEAGALSHDALYSMDKYGAIPNQFYPRQKAVDFSVRSAKQLDEILKQYLDSVLKVKPINPDWMASFIKRHDAIAGTPPATFTWEGKTYTPLTFAKEVLQFNKDAYVTITSFTHHPFYQSFALEIPDNYLLHAAYLNVPLNELIDIAKETLEKGNSLAVDVDLSNNGWNTWTSGYALFEDKKFKHVANPDTAEMAWSPELRQKLFETLVTQDDHLIHMVGLARSKGGKLFFLLKDSLGDTPFKGFDFVSESYFAINALSITVPVSALSDKYVKMIKGGGGTD